jgi:BCD family chlorophyll transporter-like MFS transporter
LQHGGVFAGMILVPVIGRFLGGSGRLALRRWTIIGCVASALALFAIAIGGRIGPEFPLKPAVFALGVGNGVYAVAAIGAMMGLAVDAGGGRDGTRMGLWGASQAISFGIGGLAGAIAVDMARWAMSSAAVAYGTVFALEGVVFLLSALLAAQVYDSRTANRAEVLPGLKGGGALAAGE